MSERIIIAYSIIGLMVLFFAGFGLQLWMRSKSDRRRGRASP